ncbi:jg15534 [Pararge aegeria aegeria]|uniref:Jg15534 protein n=1 Tax=Pararge aegeria aegeria TaxID=348720 RepID=A0A8S4RTX8_9NEOP|nr:jg15534 [Pararge aegeria aegeria]
MFNKYAVRGCLSDDSNELIVGIYSDFPETRNSLTEHSVEVGDSGIGKHARRTAVPRLLSLRCLLDMLSTISGVQQDIEMISTFHEYT